jgi:hypothetical protein
VVWRADEKNFCEVPGLGLELGLVPGLGLVFGVVLGVGPGVVGAGQAE